MHKPYEVLKGIKLPGENGAVTGRVYNWLRELNDKIRPASCVVEEIPDANFGIFFIRIANRLAQSAGVNIVVDKYDDAHKNLLLKPRNGVVHIIDSTVQSIPDGVCVYRVADSLMLSSKKSRDNFPDHISIFKAWLFAYDAAVSGDTICIDFAAVRLPDDYSSGRQSFMDVCAQIVKFVHEPSLTEFLKCLSDICSTIKRGGFRRHGAMTTSLESTSELIGEYIDIPFGYLTHLKKGVLIRDTEDLDLILKLLDKQNKGELFFEKECGYSRGVDVTKQKYFGSYRWQKPLYDEPRELRTNVCLSGDTLVKTKQGDKQIADLVGQSVEIFDGENWVTIDTFKMTDDQSLLFQLTLLDGRTIVATANHEFILTNGERKLLRELSYGDVLKECFPDGIPDEYNDKDTTVVHISFWDIEPSYCCFVETTNAFLLGNNILVGNCRGLSLLPGDQCLVSPVNLGMARTFEDIITGFKEVAQFLVDVHEMQIKEGHNLIDKQIAVGMCGLANLLRNFGVDYPQFIEALIVRNFYVQKCGYEVYQDFTKNNVAYHLASSLAAGIHAAADIGRENGMRAALAIEPTESVSRRYKDWKGFDICPNIDPPAVVPGIGIEKRHSETGVYDNQGNLIHPEFNYGSDIYPAQHLTEEQHFTLWNEIQKIMDETGQAHSGSYEMWDQWTLQKFFQWWNSNLKFVYYNRTVGTNHLVKGATIGARQRMKSQVIESKPQTCTLDMRAEGCPTCD